MTGHILVFIGLVLAFVILILLLLVQRRQLERLREQLSRHQQKQEKTAFDQSLAQAELQQQEKPAGPEKLETSTFHTDLTERYRCISAMARQGLNASQISAILQISEDEACQVIRLAGVKQN